jgi:hypothetical protein
MKICKKAMAEESSTFNMAAMGTSEVGAVVALFNAGV